MFLFPAISTMFWIDLLAALLPAVILMIYVYRQDRVEKEPAGLLFHLLLGGVLAALVSIILETIGQYFLDANVSQSDPHYYIFTAFLVVAVVEEGMKYHYLKKITWYNPNFNYRFDGIVYAVFVSLGFAAFENVGYVFEYGLSVALSRALLSVPGHMCFAVFMGYFYGRAKYRANRYQGFVSWFEKSVGYFIAVIVHGFYDSCLMINTENSMRYFVVFIILMYLIVFFLIRHESRTDQRI